MTDPRWQAVLTEARAAHDRLPVLREFCPFPEPPNPLPVTPHHVPAADLLAADTGLTSTEEFARFRDALIAAGPLAQWRETYKGSGLGRDFLDRFGCYEVIGRDAPFAAEDMRAFVVYHPPHLHYPWHHHPAEELYLVLAGEAEFAAEGNAARRLGPGGTAFHRSNQRHALTTRDHPVLAYVLWRGELGIKPVFSRVETAS